MQAKEILLEAAKLLEEKGWTRKESARNAEGFSVSEKDIAAVYFYCYGASKIK